MIVSSADFINKARHKAKVLGGGMRQVGVLAAPGIIAIEKMTNRLADDHKNAKLLAELIRDIPGVTVDPETVEINMFFIEYDHPWVTSDELVSAMLEKGVKINGARGGRTIRLCAHNDVSQADIHVAAAAMKEILG
jgi:threonine aldolase